MANLIKVIRTDVAGIDIGSLNVYSNTDDSGEVKVYSTFTSSLKALVSDYKGLGIKSVVMEATGVYWFPLYDLLQAEGIEVCIVNGAHYRNVPGRKSDIKDCQWLRELHAHGLTRPSFIPDEQIRALRVYTRSRDSHIEDASRYTQQIQKALVCMNIRLHDVISDIVGVSGCKVLDAILDGERDPQKLLALCHQSMQKKASAILESLNGHYKAEHLFALKQAYEGYTFCTNQRLACDKEIEKLLIEATKDLKPPTDCPTFEQKDKSRHNKPDIKELPKLLLTLTGGKDAAEITGLSHKSFLAIIGEIGTNMDAWPTAAHFTSWINLAPKTAQSGKIKKKKRCKSTRVAQIFKACAMALGRSTDSSAFGAFLRRIRAKSGSNVAIKATARKIAIAYYNLMRFGTDFVEQGLQKYEEQQKQRKEQYVMKMAQSFGYQLVIIESGELVH
jgi:transposase